MATASPAAAKTTELTDYCRDVAQRAHAAAAALAAVSGETKNKWLYAAADAVLAAESELAEANQKDLDAAPDYGLTDAQVDRLRLTPKVLGSIATSLREIAALPDPVGEIIESSIRPNGLEVQKVRAPLGVVFFIYESRPNVTADAAALCIKSGNAVILRGGKEAIHSNTALASVLLREAAVVGLPADAVQLVSTTDRAAVGEFLRLNEYISLAIPRGGEGLIRRVVDEATMPVMKHFAGNCHVYIHADADRKQAQQIAVNAKCQRMGVCNAAESLVLHQSSIENGLLKEILTGLAAQGVEIRGDERVCAAFDGAKTARDEDFAAEYLGPIISAAVVDDLQAGIDHVNRYGSGHTECIVTQSVDAARAFARSVDSSAVMINASTRFNDGGEFGLGAEIGISTDKFHARGPCGLKELTTYKYVVYGSGHIR